MAVCKYCGEQIEDGAAVCPLCGKPLDKPTETRQETAPEEVTAEEAPAAEAPREEVTEEAPGEEAPQEETAEEPTAEEAAEEAPGEEAPEGKAPRKRASTGKIVAAVAAIVVLVGVLAGAILYGAGFRFKIPKNDIFNRESYSVSDTQAAEDRDRVVATVGSRKLTNGELQSYYWMAVHSFISRNQYYLSQAGIDTTLPLDAQECTLQDGYTWQQYFLENALDLWHQYNALCIMAEENGFQIPQEDQDYLDGLADLLEETATQYEYESAEAMLHDDVGTGGTVDGYVNYMRSYFTAMSYFSQEYETMVPAQEEVDAYFAEHEAQLQEEGVTKEGMQVDVRHILISPEGGTLGEDGQMTYSEEEWEDCRVIAQEVYDQWLAGDATEESFAALATEKSTDGGSASNGGLYEKVTEGMMVEEFNDWIFQEGRKEGDHGMVKTRFGYHIMYYSYGEPIWVAHCRDAILKDRTTVFIDQAKAQYPAKIRYNQISLGYVDLSQ